MKLIDSFAGITKLAFAFMSGFLKFILIFLLVITGIRLLLRWLGPSIMQYFIRKIQKRASQNFHDRQQKHQGTPNGETTISRKPPNRRKSNKKVGEYIEYEEID